MLSFSYFLYCSFTKYIAVKTSSSILLGACSLRVRSSCEARRLLALAQLNNCRVLSLIKLATDFKWHRVLLRHYEYYVTVFSVCYLAYYLGLKLSWDLLSTKYVQCLQMWLKSNYCSPNVDSQKHWILLLFVISANIVCTENCNAMWQWRSRFQV